MTAQYAINVNLKTLEETANVDAIKPAMDNMAMQMKTTGWSVQCDEVQEGLNLRFWLGEKEIDAIVDKGLASRMSGIRGLIANGLNKVLGNDFSQQSTEMAKQMLKEKVEIQLLKEIENQLSGLAGIGGITVTKGNNLLFEASEPKKMKM